MGRLTVRFRGVVAIIPRGENEPARFILLNGIDPRLSGPSPDTMIPTHYPYIAFPNHSFESNRDPNVICKLSGMNHPQAIDAQKPIDSRSSWPRSTWLRTGDATHETAYAVYFMACHEILLPQGEGRTSQTSKLTRIPHLVDMKLVSSLSTKVTPNVMNPHDPPPSCAAFTDLWIKDVGGQADTDHNYRFIYGDTTKEKPNWLGPMVHELMVDIDTGDDKTPTVTLRDRQDKSNLIEITLDPKRSKQIIMGNEMMDDILGTGGLRSCAEPGYHFELMYQLSETPPERNVIPAPVCTDIHEGKNPPVRICIPPTLMAAR